MRNFENRDDEIRHVEHSKSREHVVPEIQGKAKTGNKKAKPI